MFLPITYVLEHSPKLLHTCTHAYTRVGNYTCFFVHIHKHSTNVSFNLNLCFLYTQSSGSSAKHERVFRDLQLSTRISHESETQMHSVVEIITSQFYFCVP